MQTDLTSLTFGYWAKARPPEGCRQAWHPFLWHSLDVAACAAAIMARHDVLAARLRACAGGRDVAPLVTALALLHDLGKLSRFQEKAPDSVRRATGQLHSRQRLAAPVRHTDTGLVIWQQHVGDNLDLDFDALYALERLLPGVFGHHGVPAYGHGNNALSVLNGETDKADRAAAFTFTRYALTQFQDGIDGVTAPLSELSEAAAGRLSFLLAATVNLADWLGSNIAWFPYTPPDMDPERYWYECAKPRAEQAVAAAGIIPAPATRRTAFTDLFPGRKPRPLQAHAETVNLPDGQGLVLVEDVTGSGKTEAADVLATRMVAGGLGRGIYIALPTTATAERMADRHHAMHARMSGGTAPPSLTLVHSGSGNCGVYDAGSQEAHAWMSADRRRQLSADVAVGTVDQALLAALPVRFASARLFGLAPKVLVVDEVHAHDNYTGRLLVGLLTLHAALGGSAILLSATLTADLKRSLVTAFATGAGWTTADLGALDDPSYPATTVAGRAGTRVEAIPAHSGAHRSIPVHPTEDVAAVREHLLAVARDGGCALWMRNTVDDAISSYETLAAEHADVTLLHARFPAARRAELEDHIVRRFGPDADGPSRSGAIVVATQVLEQSLDLDFDAMVCDLKPMDALVQSAGRLQRHARFAGGTVRQDGGPDERTAASLWVYGPAYVNNPPSDWYSRVLPRAAFVYPQVGWLWRTAEQLATQGRIETPGELRNLIERSLPANDAELPEAINAAADEALATAMSERSLAAGKLLSPEIGYVREEGQWPDDTRVPTRLGESIEVCLVREDPEGRWKPWRNGSIESGFLRLRSSMVAPSLFRLQECDKAASFSAIHRISHWRLVLPMIWDASSVRWRQACGAPEVTRLEYDTCRGIMKSK